MSSLLLETVYLPTLESYSYSDARSFSRNLDLKLGFEIEKAEQAILKNNPLTPWAGLDPEALQTPYPEVRLMLQRLDLQEGQAIIDLGAGYGRMGLVIAQFFPGVSFAGYEISSERVTEGIRMLNHLKHESELMRSDSIQLIHADISRTDFVVPEVDVYFIYDFGDLESIVRVIDQLKEISRRRKIRVVGRGRRTRDHIERQEPWLSQVNPPDHCGNFSIYRS